MLGRAKKSQKDRHHWHVCTCAMFLTKSAPPLQTEASVFVFAPVLFKGGGRFVFQSLLLVLVLCVSSLKACGQMDKPPYSAITSVPGLSNKPGWNNLPGPALDISNNQQNKACCPSLAFDRFGNAMAVWSETNGTPYNTYARRYNAATGLWDGQTGPGGAITASTATNISNDPSQSGGYLPSLAADCSGNFMAVWSETNGKPYNSYARRYNAATGLWDGQTGPGEP